MDSGFFTGNRKRLISSLEGGLVVLAGWTAMQWHGDTAAPFRQEANFWYLTGIEYPDWRLVIDGASGESYLIAPEIDEMHQLFDGSLSPSAAKNKSGVDKVLNYQQGEQLLARLAKKHADVYMLGDLPYAEQAGFTLNPAPAELLSVLQQLFSGVKDCRKQLAKLRAIKQPVELDLMTQAAQLSRQAFLLAKKQAIPGNYEYQVEAELAYHFRRHGASHAFEPIVASGGNAGTMHYTANSDQMADGQLVLIDAGALVNGYPADITRTFAVGAPTKRQAAVHAAVKQAEAEMISLIKPGLGLKEYIQKTDNIMKTALLSLGLMKSLDDNANFRRYFPHAISHGLGLDVHESLGGYSEFQPGMVLTVEPGIYIPEESIGVRIEDDIEITTTGHKNLTGQLSTDM